VYAAISFAFFAPPLLGDLSHTYIGLSARKVASGYADPSAQIWFLDWWPHALRHGLNPFVAHLVWAPGSFNMARATSIPGASLLMTPLTALWGPVVAYNLLMLAAPALAGWTAFLLCRQVTDRFWPSVLGGYLFGFSAYELAQMTAHLNLSLVFPVPLAVLLVVLRLQGKLGPLAFAAALGGVLVLLFSFSPEVFLTTTLFGGIALLLAMWFGRARRRDVVALAPWVLAAYVVAGAMVSPYLFYLFKSPLPVRAGWPATHSTDLLNLFLPTRTTLIGHDVFSARTSAFTAGLAEEGAYLGPLLLIVAWFGATQWRTVAGRVLLASAGIVVLLSLGPTLHVGGSESVPLPWTLATQAGLLQAALPSRFMLFAWLAVAIMAALWLAARGRRPWMRWAIAALCAIVLLPNLAAPLWRASDRAPAFFRDGSAARYLSLRTNTLVIPFGGRGLSMIWHTESGLSFPIVGGYVNRETAPWYLRWRVVRTFLNGRIVPDYARALRAFLIGERVGAIVVADHTAGPWGRLFGSLGVRPIHVGGVTLYRAPPGGWWPTIEQPAAGGG